MKTIVLDAGHGGYDYGAVNGSRYEKNDNLKLTLLVADILRRQGETVVLTRDDDTYIPLLERSYISNNANADLFISLHRNAYTNPDASGIEVYTQIGAPASTVQKAQDVLDQMAAVGGMPNRGLKTSSFSVLRNTRAPSMLLETGFITNQSDNAAYDADLNAYALAIAKGAMTAVGDTYKPIPTPTPPAPTPPSGGDPVIKSIQQGLNENYGTNLVTDGIYGANTKRALVRALQTELNENYGANLAVDGVFGAKTAAAIPNLKRGARSNLVYVLQALLYAKGYKISVDGSFGPATEAAVREFQAQNGLAADGIAGKNTFLKLLA
ncbi:MAG: N-acetylmuramoyl-L-alanine amidase [Clostridiales bacterium]|jgi:peptidoglycan hydrolase-like protein with peptidoglycan-binding domain|nr:N-acetylmuramoyl-L-alanine amidase [Clostridiales bacterium]